MTRPVYVYKDEHGYEMKVELIDSTHCSLNGAIWHLAQLRDYHVEQMKKLGLIEDRFFIIPKQQ